MSGLLGPLDSLQIKALSKLKQCKYLSILPLCKADLGQV